MSHTQGSWYVDRGQSFWICSRWDDEHGSTHCRFAEVFDMGNGEDDANLIAAAPEMLEALKAVEWSGDANEWCPWCGNHYLQRHKPDCLRQRAIAKAESKT